MLLGEYIRHQKVLPSWAGRFSYSDNAPPPSLEEKIANLGRGSVAWLEPLREWIKDSVFIGETAVSPSLVDKKSSAQKIFGSHLVLQDRRIVAVPIPPSDEFRSSRNFLKK